MEAGAFMYDPFRLMAVKNYSAKNVEADNWGAYAKTNNGYALPLPEYQLPGATKTNAKQKDTAGFMVVFSTFSG